MFEKLFAIVLALLMLCSCGTDIPEEEPIISVIEEEQTAEENEPEEIPEQEEQPEFTEPVEPEIIAEHIAALNQASLERFGAETVWDIQYGLYFK